MYAPLRDEDSAVDDMLVTAVDMTARVADEAGLRHAAARHAFLLRLSDQFRPLTDAVDIQYAAMRALGEQLGASRVGYAQIEPDGEHAVVTRNYTAGVRGLEGRYRVADYSSALLPALRKGRSVARDDVESAEELTAEERAAYAGLNVRAVADVPLLKGEGANAQLVAVQFVHFAAAHHWTADELQMLHEVAALTWEALARARAEASLRTNEDRRAFLLTLSDTLRPLSDAVQIQAETARLLREQFGAGWSYYVEFNDTQSRITVSQDSVRNGLPSFVGEHPFDDMEQFLAQWQAGQLVCVEDFHRSSLLGQRAKDRYLAAGINAFLGVPVLKSGVLIAALVLADTTAHSWSSLAIDLTSESAERTWAAVERARAEAALRASEARLRLALDVAEVGTWTLDPATGVGELDARGAGIVGLVPGRVTEVTAAQAAVIHPDDLARVQAAIAVAVATGAEGNAIALEYRVVRPDGSIGEVASRARVIADASGVVRVIGINRDVTAARAAALERERLLADTEAARTGAEAANRAKGEFLAVMSHELRTPLNAIGGYTELIELGIHGPVTDAQRIALARIQASQRHLQGLIAGVLDYARASAGAVTYRLIPVPVAQAVAEAQVLVAPQLRARGLGYSWSGAPSELAALADREKLQQILLNLLGNAVKFTHEREGVAGRIDVVCTAETADGTGRVAIHVRDTGSGIAADQLERVFEPFVQADQRLTRPGEGVGLGLAISRDLARGMHGDLTVESTLAVGSTFTLTLPAA